MATYSITFASLNKHTHKIIIVILRHFKRERAVYNSLLNVAVSSFHDHVR